MSNKWIISSLMAAGCILSSSAFAAEVVFLSPTGIPLQGYWGVAEVYMGKYPGIAATVVGKDSLRGVSHVCEITTAQLARLNSSAIELVNYINSTKSNLRLKCIPSGPSDSNFMLRYKLVELGPSDQSR